MNAQIIKKNGQKEFVVIPYTDFLQMQQTIEDYEDLTDLRKAKAKTANEPSIPYNDIADKVKEKKVNIKGKKVKVKKSV